MIKPLPSPAPAPVSVAPITPSETTEPIMICPSSPVNINSPLTPPTEVQYEIPEPTMIENRLKKSPQPLQDQSPEPEAPFAVVLPQPPSAPEEAVVVVAIDDLINLVKEDQRSEETKNSGEKKKVKKLLNKFPLNVPPWSSMKTI